jgi:hypothetical protein
MQRDRAWRRSQRERKIKKVYSWIHAYNWNWFKYQTFEESQAEHMQQARRRHKATHPCSGWCCGNPRAHFGSQTLAEQRFIISCEEIYDELEIRVDFQTTRKRW